MPDLTLALRGELNSLEAELAADPRYQKIAKIRELLAIYDNSRSQPLSRQTVEPAQPHSTSPAAGKPESKAARVRSVIAEMVRANGIVHRQVLLDHLIAAGIMGTEASPMASLAAYLSEMAEFESHGGGKWGLRSPDHAPGGERAPKKITYGSNPNSRTTAIVNAAVTYLRQKGSRAETPEIQRALIAAGLNVGDARPDTVSSCLSHSPLFDNVRGQGYGLVEWSLARVGETETPDSSELSGAPRSNGMLPLSQ